MKVVILSCTSMVISLLWCLASTSTLDVEAKPLKKTMNITGDVCTDCVVFFLHLRPAADVLYSLSNGTAFNFGLERAFKVQCGNIFKDAEVPSSSESTESQDEKQESVKKTLCSYLSSQNVDSILQLIQVEHGLVPKDVCQQIGVCSNTTTAAVPLNVQ